MDSPSLREKFQYRLDTLFSRGTGALIVALAIVSLIIIALAAVVLVITGFAPGDGEPLSFFEAFWQSLMRTLDAGTMGGDEGWGFRLVQFIVTLGGVFIISSLIGVISSGVNARIESLRKGRSRVLEQGHTIILGWSEEVFTILSELVIANRDRRHACIVVLGEKDKTEMESEIQSKVGATGSTQVVCRSGSPIEMADLEIVNLNTARSIIIPSPVSDDPDAEVIKIVLAVLNSPSRRSQPYHIVAELKDNTNLEIARTVGKGEVEFVLVAEFIARIIAQTCQQSGLSVVYTELLNFEGNEIYFTGAPRLAGKSFGDALLAYQKNSVIGYCPAGGNPCLLPPLETILSEGDELIVIAPDDSQVENGELTLSDQVMIDVINAQAFPEPTPEKTLILGWNWRGPVILRELDNYVAPASRVDILAGDENIEQQIAWFTPGLKNLAVQIRQGETTDRRTLEEIPRSGYTHVILLSDSDDYEAQKADSRTLMTLLHLRDIAERNTCQFSIVSEMLDIRNRNLAEVTRADDFIVSDKLVSMVLAQVSENKRLNAVFADLFDVEGAEIYLRSVCRYIHTGKAVNFYTIIESARRRGEIAIGYRLKSLANNGSQFYGVVINPPKSNAVKFQDSDSIIVISNS